MKYILKVQKYDKEARVTIPAHFIKFFRITGNDKIEWKSYKGKLIATLIRK